MSVVEDAMKIVRTGANTRKAVERLRLACALQRAKLLAAQPSSSWTASKLAARVNAELAAVQKYIKNKDSLIAGTESKTPSHLNLKDEAGLASANLRTATALEKEYRGNRKLWICQIVWRSVTIHAELWKAGDPPKLEESALDEVLDRRLRVIEQIDCNVNGGPKFNQPRAWKVTSASGPWEDGLMNRNFEYPGVQPAKPFEKFSAQLQPLGWVEAANKMSFVWSDPATGDPRRISSTVSSSWKIDPADDWFVYQPSPGVNAAGVIAKMVSFPRNDFWNRSWIFCDHVSSLLGIEAMLVGAERRAKDATERAANATAMETLLNTPGHIRLGPVVGSYNKGCLMCQGLSGPHFENGKVDFDFLQVGDLVRFWNSLLYNHLPPGGGAWGSEFSFVMGIDVDDRNGKIVTGASGPKILLAGHGVDTTHYNGMALDTASQIADRLFTSRALVENFLASHPNTDFCDTVPACKPCSFELWSPYESFDAPGAWWVKIPKSVWHAKWDYPDIDSVLSNVPRTVADKSASGGDGYHPPKDLTAVYFPLYEPDFTPSAPDGDQWREYLRRRKLDPTFAADLELSPLTVDGRLALGLFYYGKSGKSVDVVRPRVRV